MRDSISRPNSSVPSKKAREGAPGSPKVAATACAGSCGASAGAKTAAATRLSTIAAPTASIGLSFSFTGHPQSVSRKPITLHVKALGSYVRAKADARVEPGVEQVDGEVGDHNQKRGEKHRAHDQGNVEIEDRLVGEAAN